MKCVKHLSGEVKRLSNEMAQRQVTAGLASFCPKSEWKALRVAPVKVEQSQPSDEKPKKAKKGGK